MGLIGEALTSASGDSLYADGFSPDNCWFRNGYIRTSMINDLRAALLNGDELSDVDCILTLSYLSIGQSECTPAILASYIDRQLQKVIDRWQSNRGVPYAYEEEEFLMRMLGWHDYCLLLSIISKGEMAALTVRISENGSKRGYYIEAIKDMEV